MSTNSKSVESNRLCDPVILLPRCLMNGLSYVHEIYNEYSVAPTDDLIRFWGSKVEVTAGRRHGEGIHVDAAASTSVFQLVNVFTGWHKMLFCCFSQ